MLSSKYCRQQARICFELAAVATNRTETERLVMMAQRFTRLANQSDDDAPDGPYLRPHMIPRGTSDSGMEPN
jgi:hypothetical protein